MVLRVIEFRHRGRSSGGGLKNKPSSVEGEGWSSSSKPPRPFALNAQADGSREPRRSFLLPLDVMPNILLRLPAQSIIRFKSVCKLFYYICNPLIGDWIPLPDSAYRLRRYGRMVAFYYYASACEYRLLWRVRATVKDRYEVLSLGSSEWRRIRVSRFNNYLNEGECVPMHERLYRATTEDHIYSTVDVPSIIVFDMEAEEFSTMSIPSSGRIRSSCSESDPESHHLMRLGEGQLCWCQVTKLMEIVHVYLLKDYTREVWVEQYTISLQGIALPRNPTHFHTNSHRNDQPSGFNSNGVPYIRPMMTTVHDDDDQEIVFGWYEWQSDCVLGVLSYNTKLNKARSVRVKGSFPSEHLDHCFQRQYVESPVSCYYIDNRRWCLHCGK